MDREYIKIKKPPALPNLIQHLRDLDDKFWKELVFSHLLTFYKGYNVSELNTIINNEQKKKYPRVERVIAKYLRLYLNNDRKFNLHFYAFGEVTNDEKKEGNYDIVIHNTYWKNQFHFECKNLDKSQDLINKYVYHKMNSVDKDGGVYRYFNGKYAQKQDFGGMIGFVLSGDIKELIDRIIQKLEDEFDISPEGNLLKSERFTISENDFTFTTIHERKCKEFTIYHLLFRF